MFWLFSVFILPPSLNNDFLSAERKCFQCTRAFLRYFDEGNKSLSTVVRTQKSRCATMLRRKNPARQSAKLIRKIRDTAKARIKVNTTSIRAMSRPGILILCEPSFGTPNIVAQFWQKEASVSHMLNNTRDFVDVEILGFVRGASQQKKPDDNAHPNACDTSAGY